MTTPAEAYAAFRDRQADPDLAEFRSAYDFAFDDFQLRACSALSQGHGVLVAAPTGSGKTVVGEYAVHLALGQDQKCFYTTPIKALSNQKYRDLVARYGPERVGLLTGDTSVNGEAPVVVMTTEVLRNMLYAGSGTLGGLGYVVLDEVHYLADRSRGAVWEEVIIHLPERVQVAALSATVSNAEEFGDWLGQVRGSTHVVVAEERPVPLWQHVLVGTRLYDLYADEVPGPGTGAAGGRAKGRAADGPGTGNAGGLRISPELLRVAAREQWQDGGDRWDRRGSRGGARRDGAGRDGAGRGGAGSGRGARGRTGPGSAGSGRGGRGRPGAGRGPARFRPPFRPAVISRLDREGLLPAITFIFSRAGCDAAVRQCLSAGLTLTTPDEAARIEEFALERTADLAEPDRAVLGYDDWLDGLRRGVAAHHAGLLPVFKEVIEELFTDGLIRAVFATETLALGINMPARTVMIERMDKWNGQAHVPLTAGEYTQLTGRAGRRGIDVEGHAVVLWQPGLDLASLAGLAGTRTYPLNSSFRPSYNMAVNLTGWVGRDRAAGLLESSFAQFQADRGVVGLTQRLRQDEQRLTELAGQLECDQGDIAGYLELRRVISELERESARGRAQARRADAERSLRGLDRGDLIQIPGGRRAGLAVVLTSAPDLAGGGPLLLTERHQVKRLGIADLTGPVTVLGTLRVPDRFNARSPKHRRDLAASIRNWLASHELAGQRHRDRTRPEPAAREEIDRLRRRLREHPCHGCPDREQHSRTGERYQRLARETEQLRERVAGRSHVIARTFARVCTVLGELGYLDGDTVTADGKRLAGLYTELDLVAAECLRGGLWERLDPAELAACVSALSFESRSGDAADDSQVRLPKGQVPEVLAVMTRTWARLSQLERRHKLDFLRRPDPGFAWAAYRWARGVPLPKVLAEVPELTPGDFVRAVKQLLDLLDQVAAAARGGALTETARQAVSDLRHGVIAYTGMPD